MKKKNIVEKLTFDMRTGVTLSLLDEIQLMNNLELCDRDGRTLLTNAACYDRIDVVRLLLKCGANVNTIDNLGNTPLHAAVLCGNVSIMRVLLENGAIVNQKNNFGNTPLWVAKPSQPKEVFTTLLNFGANPEIKNNYNISAMDCMRAYPEIIELFLSYNYKNSEVDCGN